MSITIDHFIRLYKSDQLKYIQFYGVLVAERPDGGDRFYLYRVNDFYVEVLAELSSINESIRLIITRVGLEGIVDPYLRYIDISELIPA